MEDPSPDESLSSLSVHPLPAKDCWNLTSFCLPKPAMPGPHVEKLPRQGTAETVVDSSWDHSSSRPSIVSEDEESTSLQKPRIDHRSWDKDNLERVRKHWELTDRQFNLVLKFKDTFEGVESKRNEPHAAVMFLSEHKWDFKQTVKQFRKTLEWREAHHVDSILEDYDPPSDFWYFPRAIIKGNSRDGNPILVERPGAAHQWELVHRYGAAEVYKEEIFRKETMRRGRWVQEWEDKHGKPMNKVTIIIDVKGLGLRHLSPSILGLGGQISDMIQKHYCGSAQRIIIIRAPYVFKIAWAFFRKILKDSIKEILCFATEKEYLEVLSQYMDINDLPEAIYPAGRGEAVDDFKETVWIAGALPERT